MIDTIIGRHYRIVRLLGKGGMGAVYEAEHTLNGMRVAVKVITAESAKNATLVSRFEREARATISIDTPHIVRVLDAGADDVTGIPYLAMEHLDGEDASQLIKRLGPLTPDLALRMVAQACLGLHRAHEARIIHRDIKPANLFLAKGGAGERIVKLLDFGVAKITRDPTDASAETGGLTRSGSMLGSPLYMSPEQARGHKEIDRRSDVWSMGVVLYQALTGRTPHQDSDALGELIISICTEVPEPIQEIAPWVAPEIAAVAHGALRFNPKERYQTAAEMLDAIRPLLTRGWVIDESLLVPLAAEARSRVAPRLQTQPDAPPTKTRSGTTRDGQRDVDPDESYLPTERIVLPGGRGDGFEGGPSGRTERIVLPHGRLPLATELLPTSMADESTSSPQATSIEGTTLVREPPSVPAPFSSSGSRGSSGASGAPRSPGRLGIVVGAAGALVVGGLIAIQVMSRSASITPLSQPSAVLAPPTAPVTAAPAARTHTVSLVILPDGATVEINGTPVPVKDGVVAITGALGSVHEVRVSSAGDEVIRNVVVAENGAVPAKIQVEPKAKPGPTAAPFAAPTVRPIAPRSPGGPVPNLRDQR